MPLNLKIIINRCMDVNSPAFLFSNLLNFSVQNMAIFQLCLTNSAGSNCKFLMVKSIFLWKKQSTFAE